MRSAPLPDRSPPTMETRTSSPPAQIAGAPSAQAGRDLGILALVVLGPIWGYGWVATKVALGYSQPLTFAAQRAPRHDQHEEQAERREHDAQRREGQRLRVPERDLGGHPPVAPDRPQDDERQDA